MQILLEEYFGKKLRTHQSEMEEGCHHCKKYGYQLIIKEYGKNPGQAKKLVRNVGQAQSGTILQLGLAQMEKNMISSGSVYVVENEMVFTYLIHNLGNRQYTLLCTSGQPRSAVQLLLPMILKSGAQIYYSWDIDPDGIRKLENILQELLHDIVSETERKSSTSKRENDLSQK